MAFFQTTVEYIDVLKSIDERKMYIGLHNELWQTGIHPDFTYKIPDSNTQGGDEVIWNRRANKFIDDHYSAISKPEGKLGLYKGNKFVLDNDDSPWGYSSFTRDIRAIEVTGYWALDVDGQKLIRWCTANGGKWVLDDMLLKWGYVTQPIWRVFTAQERITRGVKCNRY